MNGQENENNLVNDVPESEPNKYTDFEYEIGDKVYVQKAMVLGQVRLLTDLLKAIDLPQTLKPADIASAIEDILAKAIAVVLLEKGKTTPSDIQNRDIVAMATDFEWTLDGEVIVRVISDFLFCNPIASLLKLMNSVTNTMYVPNVAQTETMKTTEIGLIE